MRRLTVPILETGAEIDVLIGVSTVEARKRARQGREPQTPVHVRMLVDTGATCTLIDDGVMRALQLTATGPARLHSSSTNGVAVDCHMYAVQLTLGGIGRPETYRIDPLEVAGAAFINQPYQGLLGRDVLNTMQLSWNGRTRTLVLEYI